MGRKLPPIPGSDTEKNKVSLERSEDPLNEEQTSDLKKGGNSSSSFKDVLVKEQKETTNKIMVTGFRETTTLESLEFFFENKRRSGGGAIVRTELKTDPQGLIIEFEDNTGKHTSR